MIKRREGQWKRKQFGHGPDSALHGIYHNNNNPTKHFHQVTMGTIEFARAEPIYRQTAVDVNLTKGGGFTNVAWPGGQVNVSSAGVASPSSQQIHGLWEAPLPGQQVLLGFVEGEMMDPVVINKYPYNALQDPIYEAAHNQPLTQKDHGPLDIILGHFTGSYMALRGTLPIPGHIDISSVASITVASEVETILNSVDITLTASEDATIKLKSDGLIVVLNASEDLKTLMGDLIDLVKNLTTTGSPTNHVVSAASQTALSNIKTRYNNLLGSS